MNNLNDLQAEYALIGSLLIEPTGWDEVADYVKPADLQKRLHRDVYQAIDELLIAGKKVDVICVSQHLAPKLSYDPFTELCEISRSQFVPKNIKHYAEIVKRRSIDHKLVKAAQEIISNVHEQKENRLDHAQQCLAEIADQTTSEIALPGDVLRTVINSIDERHSKKSEIIGLPTGFIDLDKITHGLHGGDLIILAGRPSMGKTLLGMNIAEYVAVNQKKPVAIFSLEMSKEQLFERTLTSVAKVNSDQMRSGQLSETEFQKLTPAIAQLCESKLFVDDRPSLSVSDIRAKCRRIKREYGLALVLVDYLTLMVAEGENETIRIGNISRGLKLLARDLGVPLIAISQLNRAVEHRNEKRPCMADLRQSGAIEQDADLILFIYRNEVYNKDTHDKGLAEIIISKHRNGNLGTVYLTFNSHHCRFDNFSGYVSPPKPEKTWQGRSFDY